MRKYFQTRQRSAKGRLIGWSVIALAFMSLGGCTIEREHRFTGELTGIEGVSLWRPDQGNRMGDRHLVAHEGSRTLAFTVGVGLTGFPPGTPPVPSGFEGLMAEAVRSKIPVYTAATVILTMDDAPEGEASGWITLERGTLRDLFPESDDSPDPWVSGPRDHKPTDAVWYQLEGTCAIESLYSADSFDLVVDLTGDGVLLQGRARSGYVTKPSKYLLLPLVPVLILSNSFP